MQTQLLESIRQTAQGSIAEAILRKCVHCGFCNATCPTYQLLGDETEGPRGRIYLIKQLLEGQKTGIQTLHHLDHCLLCRSCETTCPSGVQYSKLLDIGRHFAATTTPRPWIERVKRLALRTILPRPAVFKFGLKWGKRFKHRLPAELAHKIPDALPTTETYPPRQHARQMLLLDGCVQSSLAPNINAATARVLDKLGISVIREQAASCCGALEQHLDASTAALERIQRNIDAWWPYIETNQIEGIISTASGCGVMLKDYGYYLRDIPAYAEKAARVSELTNDISEILTDLDLTPLQCSSTQTIAWHPPCTLQHGQKLSGVVEAILAQCGYSVIPIKDAHLCCGSAGTYSILQPVLADTLRTAKIKNLMEAKPELIVTGNIGCQSHLQEISTVPVMHWIHLLDN